MSCSDRKFFRGIDIRGAALDDVACLIFHVPGEGQTLNVGKQPVPHGLDQSLRGLRIVHPEGILGEDLHRCHGDHRQGHDPKILPQIGKAPDPLHKLHNKPGEIPLLPSKGAVHRRPDDLGLEHIRQGRNSGAEDAHQEIPLGAL